MAPSSNFNILRGLSLVGGLSVVATAAYLNVSHVSEAEGGMTSPQCIAIIALAFGSALGIPVMLASWASERKGLAVVAFVAVVAGELFGLQLSAERLLASREARAHQARAANARREVVLAKIATLEADRRRECATGYGDRCAKAKAWEDASRAELATLPPVRSAHLLAEVTGLPAWMVEVVPALSFSSALTLLGLVLVGFGGHGAREARPRVEIALAPVIPRDDVQDVVDWVKQFRQRHGRDPQIPELQQVFNLPKTTAWRRIKSS